MKTARRLHCTTLILGLTTLACSPGLSVRATGAEPTADASPAPVSPVPPDDSAARWNDIKALSFDQRAQFATGLKRLENRVDAQIAELTARRAAMKSITDTKDWDFAMKSLASARSYLIGMGADSTKATPENWDQSKDRVGRAWVETQEDYAKVKASTTNR